MASDKGRNSYKGRSSYKGRGTYSGKSSYIGKRLMDIVIALTALVLTAPLAVLIAVLIRLDSPGPAVYLQRRSGQNGVIFNMFKFRSMRLGTPELATDKFPHPEQYLTRVGRFIRRASLDELPQLLNILRGEMSVVGPRPALYNQNELIAARTRLGIQVLRPGLTGYAQIMGRDNITEEQKVAYDLDYLEHISLGFDLQIILNTLIRVVKADDVKMRGDVNLQSAVNLRGDVKMQSDSKLRGDRQVNVDPALRGQAD